MRCFTGEKPLHFIGGNAAAIIAYPDKAYSFFLLQGDNKPSGLTAAAAQAMLDGIFNNGLQYQAGNRQLQKSFLQLIFHKEGMARKNQLD